MEKAYRWQDAKVRSYVDNRHIDGRNTQFYTILDVDHLNSDVEYIHCRRAYYTIPGMYECPGHLLSNIYTKKLG